MLIYIRKNIFLKANWLLGVIYIFMQYGMVSASELEDARIKAFTCNTALKIELGNEYLNKTQSYYKEVSSLKASFLQYSRILGMTDDIQSSGEIVFKKPGKMDWNYKQPDIQRFISDGETVWFYEPKVNQVTVGQLTKSFSSDVPVSFLLGLGDLTASFDLVSACQTIEGYLFELKPKSETSSFKSFSLLVNKSDFIPQGAKILDQGDTLTQFIFQNVNTKDLIEDKYFSYTPPSGVDIVYNN